MKIEVWSDFVCPFCYIGKRRLEQAVEKFPHQDKVEIEYRSYELDPDVPENVPLSIHESLAKKYGMSVEEAKQMHENIGEQAKTVGLTYNFDGMKPTNTLHAHRLVKFAATHGKEKEITEKLLHAYFVESKHIGDIQTLVAIGEQFGLNRSELLCMLKDDKAYVNEVRADEHMAQQIGVRGVPFFVFNKKYALSGAQPVEVFLEVLQKVWQEENPSGPLQDLGEQAPGCADGSCGLPNQ